jgi:predicted  nucleic acid-binding Zn-ribbon protein
MTNEFMHADKNLKDANIFIKNLQNQVLQERLAKEDYQKSNYELKQNEMLLISKVDLLNREKTNLQNQIDDANKKIASLTENLSKLNI